MAQQMTSQPKGAVLYLRARCIGGSDDGVDASLARQRDICTRIAKQHGATVIHEYTAIGGVRGGHVQTIVSDMLNQVSREQVDYIIAVGIDRLCRGPVQADLELIRAIQGTGATLLCDNGEVVDLARFGRTLTKTHGATIAGRSA